MSAGRCVGRRVVGEEGRERRRGGPKQCRVFSGKRKLRSKDGSKLEIWKTEKRIEGREMSRGGW